ncbi:hypothetical protein ACFLV7_07915 [Chloroflexota bacterium]
MKLSAPKQITFWISVVLLLLGILGTAVSSVPFVGPIAWIFLVLAYVVLALGNLLSGF